MNSNTSNRFDGFDLWFFGGTPGPDDLDGQCMLKQTRIASIDEDDARIPAFAHRCHCRQHDAADAKPRAEEFRPLRSRNEPASLMSCHL